MTSLPMLPGISVEDLQRLAKMIVDAQSACILWAMGVTQHTMALNICGNQVLLLVTGNYKRPGTERIHLWT